MYGKPHRGSAVRSFRKNPSRGRGAEKSSARPSPLARSLQSPMNAEAALSPFWAWRIAYR
jgi:hypothetical protein